jgi:hypothetical protein
MPTNSQDPRILRKQLMGHRSGERTREPSHLHEIDLHTHATIHFSSEDPEHPIEHMLDGSSGKGATRWMSAHPDVTEELMLEFDEPQRISHVVFEVEEQHVERTQEVRAEFSTDGGNSYRQAFIQEYTFSPNGATYQCENLSLDLRAVTHFRLRVVPNKGGSGRATLTSLRLFS